MRSPMPPVARPFRPMRLGLLAGSLLAGSLLAAPPAATPAPEEPLRILHADRAPVDRGQEELVLEGHVRVARGTATLSGEHLVYRRKARILEMRGEVAILDRDSRLRADYLLYDLGEDAATAWGSPRLVQGTGGSESEQVALEAVQLRLFPKEGRVEAIEDVRVEQSRGEGLDRRLEMRVRCRVAEILARGKRNVFKGDVRLDTPEVGATSGRMLYEQESRRAYLLDGARVWNYDSQGERLDELSGDKIIHFLDEGRTIALGGVRAQVHPEASTGTRFLGTPGEAGTR